MTARRSPWRGVICWALVGVALLGVFLALVFRMPLLSATGLERSGASTTVPPTLFDPPPTPSSQPQLAAPVGPIAAASQAPDGPIPDRDVLEQRLQGIDIKALQKGVPEGGNLVTAYQVLDSATGNVLAQSSPDQLLIPASNAKLLTITAVLHAFEATDVFDTTVVMPEPGRLVLVGGGDPLLASAKTDAYPGPASLEELAATTAEVLRAKGLTTITLGYDASLFQESWASTWPATYRDQVTPISALWADEGRDANKVRSTDPALDAATIFAASLKAQGITVDGVPAAATGSGEEVARVSSPGVHALAEQAMEHSNNSYTEVLGMQLALKQGKPATFAGTAAAVQEVLTGLGLWHEGATLRDGSGLSRENQVPVSMLARVARHVAITPRLEVVQDGFPVAGVSGSLNDRFSDDISAPARGIARAKTGTLSLVSTLSGTTVTADGREVVFAFATNGSTDGWAARVWADHGVGIITGCGC